MSRKHVFPVCSPNLLEFSPENSTVIFEGGTITSRFFHADGSWGQILIGEASTEEWTAPGYTPGKGWFYFGYWEGLYSEPRVFDPPPAGTVICAGVKDKLTSTFDSVYTNSRSSLTIGGRQLWQDFSISFSQIRTDESKEDFYADPFWVTYMFDGKTWQILGSNNWV